MHPQFSHMKDVDITIWANVRFQLSKYSFFKNDEK
jgi:hypothetical protein